MRALAIALLLFAALIPVAAAEPVCPGDAIPVIRGKACADASVDDRGITISTTHVEYVAGSTFACAAATGNVTVPIRWMAPEARCGADRCSESVGDDGTPTRRCDAEARASGACDPADDPTDAPCAADAGAAGADTQAAAAVRKKPGRTTYANIALERNGTSTSSDCDDTADFRKILDHGEAGDNVAARCSGGGDLDDDGRADEIYSTSCRGTTKEEVERGQVARCSGFVFATPAGCAFLIGITEEGRPLARSCLG